MAISSISTSEPRRNQDHRRRRLPPSLAGKLGPLDFPSMEFLPKAAGSGLSVKLVCEAGEGVLARLGSVNGEFVMVLAPCQRL